jgi:hypothetical protein
MGSLGGLLLVMAAGCGTSGEPPGADLLFSPTPSATPAPPSPSASAVPSPDVTTLPASCTELVPASTVAAVVGVSLPGATTYLLEEPLPESGRLGRVTCGFGVPDRPREAPAAVEVSRNLYESDEAALARLPLTRDAAVAEGDQVRDAPIAGLEAFLVLDDESVSYVIADPPETVVLTLQRGLVPPRAEQAVLEDLAAVVLGVER